VFPEGMLVLNPSAAAIVQLCDGRSREDLFAEISRSHTAATQTEVWDFLDTLAGKGLLRDGDA
jgi:pyrroloquinoline quinone biosynthesis protein D